MTEDQNREEQGVLVRFSQLGFSRRVGTGVSLFRIAREAQLPIASSCDGDGICSRCALTVVDGGEWLVSESEHERRIKQANHVPRIQRLACLTEVVDVSGASEAVVDVVTEYW